MVERIIYFYRLKDGVTIGDFWKWSIEKDLPITSAQPGVQKFETFELTSSGEGAAHYDVMEYIEADSYDAWSKVGKLPAMKEIAEAWPLYGDADSVLEVRLKKIE